MSTKGSLEAIIEIAKKEVGTIEGPKDNETKYGKWTGMNFQPWCQSFVSWCAFTSGLDPKKYPKSASTVAASDWFKKNNRWADARNDDPTPGDWIYFDFPEDGVNRISHVGICIKNNGNGTIQVIEGNTSGTSKGDQRNGGMCVEKTRAYVKDNKLKLINGIVGWGRPVYAGEENTPLLSKVGSSDLAPKAAKSVLEKPTVSTKPTAKAKVTPAVLKKGSKGPQVKEIQKALGLKADGQFGPGTEKAVKDFQKSKSINPNGIVDSNTLKAIKGK
jgi:peptidoglycan hydrolase-like protein with peptidoglycan-binding domain